MMEKRQYSRGRKAVAELEEQVQANPRHYRYVIKVDGRGWAYGWHKDVMRAAADAALRGWARGKRVEVTELK